MTKQTDIFSMFNMVDEVEEAKREKEALAKKEQEEKQAKQQEELKQKLEQSKKDGTAAPTKPANSPDEFKPNEETIIRYVGEEFPITAFFSPEELAEGLLVIKKDKEPERQPLTAELLRVRMEKEFPELVKNHTEIVFLKKKNLVVPVMKAKAKGSDGALVTNQAPFFPIPFQILNQFVTLANLYAEYQLEIHADVYCNKTTGAFFLDVPAQMVGQFITEVTESAWSIATRVEDAVKLMEIHSHHDMMAVASELDNRSERSPGMVYAIVGETSKFFPTVAVREFVNEEIGHILHPLTAVFENPFTDLPDFDSNGIEVLPHG